MWNYYLVLIYLAVLVLTDVKTKKIPLKLILFGSIPAVVCAIVAVLTERSAGIGLLMGFIPGIVMLMISWLSKGAGLGDGIVLLQLNLFLLMEKVVVAFAISLLAIGVFSAAVLVIGKAKRQTRIPYMPFLWIGCLGMMLVCG